MCRFSGILLKHELRKKDVSVIKKIVVITYLFKKKTRRNYSLQIL